MVEAVAPRWPHSVSILIWSTPRSTTDLSTSIATSIARGRLERSLAHDEEAFVRALLGCLDQGVLESRGNLRHALGAAWVVHHSVTLFDVSQTGFEEDEDL